MTNKNLEMKKPSALCQVLYYSDYTKKEQANLSPLQFDLIDVVFKFVSTTLELEKVDTESLDEWASINHFEIELKDIASMLGRYKNGYYEQIVDNLLSISKIQVLTNTLYKDKSYDSVLYHFIRKIAWNKDKQTTNKSIKVWLEPEILHMFLSIKRYYTIYHLQIQFGLKSRYSKALYVTLKDYDNIGGKTLNFQHLQRMMMVDTVERPNLKSWSNFNRDLLKRTVKEINSKSDIFITYTPIKERDENNKLTVTNVKFELKKQKSILVDYTDPSQQVVIEATPQLSRAEQKLEDLAQKQIEAAKIFGTIIKNEKQYKRKVIENLLDSGVDVDAIVELEDIMDELRTTFHEEKNDKHQLMIIENFNGEPIVSVSNEYLIYSPVNKLNITKTVKETISVINNLKQNGNNFILKETSTKVSDLEFSYL